MRFSWILMAWVWLMESAAWLGKPRPAVSRCFLVAQLHHWKERVTWVTLWLFNIAMENGPLIDGLPIQNGDVPWLWKKTGGTFQNLFVLRILDDLNTNKWGGDHKRRGRKKGISSRKGINKENYLQTNSISPSSLLLGVLNSFLRCVRLFVTGGVRLSGLVRALSPFICLPSCVSLSGGVRLSGLVCALSPFICLPSFASLHLPPFMCLPEWWRPPPRSCLCLVSLHVSPWVVVSCLCLVSLHLSPFMCLPEWLCPPLRSCLCLVSLHLSPFTCLPSCVCVSLHVSPFMCLLSGGVPLSVLVCALCPFICLPSCGSLSGGVRLSGLVCALYPSCVSLHVSPWVVVSASPVLSVPRLPSFVSLHLSPFKCLPSCVSWVVVSLSPVLSVPCVPSFVSLHVAPWVVVSASPVLSVLCLPSCVSLSGGVRLSGLVCALSPFICLPEWWCPPLRSCLCLVSLHVSPWMVVSASSVLSVPCLPSFVSLHMSPWVVVSASPVLSVPCLPSCVSLNGGVRLFGLVCALSPFICLPSCVSLIGGVRLSGLVCALSPFICLPDWWCPPLRSCLCLVSLHVFPWVAVSASPVLSVPCLPSFVSLYLSPWVVVSASPVLSVPCFLSFVSLLRLVCFALSPFICLPFAIYSIPQGFQKS